MEEVALFITNEEKTKVLLIKYSANWLVPSVKGKDKEKVWDIMTDVLSIDVTRVRDIEKVVDLRYSDNIILHCYSGRMVGKKIRLNPEFKSGWFGRSEVGRLQFGKNILDVSSVILKILLDEAIKLNCREL